MKFCMHCGTKIADESQFCSFCGHSCAVQGVPVAPPAEPQPVAPVQAVPVQPQPVAPVQAVPVQPQPVAPVQAPPVQPQPVAPVQAPPVQPQPISPVQTPPVPPQEPVYQQPVNPQGGYYAQGGNPQDGYYAQGTNPQGNPQGGYYAPGGNPQGGYYGQPWNGAPNNGQQAATAPSGENLFNMITGSVNRMTGGTGGTVRPPLRKIFSKVFVKHSRAEAEEIFICGTAKTTPVLSNSDTAWPQPWLYTRILLAFAAAFFMMYICGQNLQNENALPGVIFLGAFMVPIATFVFFFELNTPKNVSFFTALKIFMVGGCASLLLSLFLFEIVQVRELDYMGAILVGIVEEVGKLGIVAFFIFREKNAKYTVNGLLIGAAVGAGFAAFESAGYAFRSLIAGGYTAMIDNIFLRGVLAPGGHVVWAAMTGYAIMLVKGDAPFSLNFLGKAKFWKIFWIPITLHAIWDMPIDFLTNIYFVHIVLCLVSWVIIFIIINNCLNQIGQVLQRQEAAPAQQPMPDQQEPVSVQQ